jgi:hypothetical protein
MRTMAEESAQVLLTTCIGHRRPRRTPSEIQAMERAQMTATPAVGSGRIWSVHDLSLRRERETIRRTRWQRVVVDLRHRIHDGLARLVPALEPERHDCAEPGSRVVPQHVERRKDPGQRVAIERPPPISDLIYEQERSKALGAVPDLPAAEDALGLGLSPRLGGLAALDSGRIARACRRRVSAGWRWHK